MKIVLTGAGSGGHITPLLAVAAELKRQEPRASIIYIGQTGDALGDIPADSPHIDQTFTIRAGKFRRYHGEGWRQLLDVRTMALNVRDAFYVLAGLYQGWRLLRQLRPDVIFIKGGFVGVPIGLAAAWLRRPYVTHDSDAIPGLANRIIARWAACHAVALPADTYPYPEARTVNTGIPLQVEFTPVTAALQKRYRQEIEIPGAAKLLFVIGGGLGAQRVNTAVAEAVPHLLHEFPDLYVVHGVGRANESVMEKRYAATLGTAEQGRLRVFGYLPDVYRYSGAADLVITRAGATNLAEFALQGKACVVVPNPVLAGGHQLENARYLANKQAAEIISEEDLAADPNRLARLVSGLLRNEARRKELSKQLAAFAKPYATRDLARLIVRTAQQGRTDAAQA